jgi:mono/diheme cytochrome c family protein
MNKNKYLLLISSLGVFLLLAVAAIQENFAKDWRKVQATARTEDGPVAVQLRQVINRGLGISDRCTSCHLSMGPGEQGAAGPGVLALHKPVFHDPAEYGCTACHGGQGHATEKADAHGDVLHWPQPMLPVRYSYAGCGTCHIALNVPEQTRFNHARLAFERLDCLACHRVDGRGGTVRPDGGGMEATDLSKAALAGYDKDWYAKHLAHRDKAAAGPWRTSFAPITQSDLDLLAIYMDTRVGAPRLIEAKAAFLAAGCLGCHMTSGVGGDDGPDLSTAGLKDPGYLDFSRVPGKHALDNWFTEHFRSPTATAQGSQMPIMRISNAQLDLLNFYLLSLRRRDIPSSYAPKDRVRALQFKEREFATDPATLFAAFCSGCHGADGNGYRSAGMPAFPSISNPDFLDLVSDQFLIETIRQGRPGRRMPAWEKDSGLRPDEIRAVVSYLRAIAGSTPRPDPMPSQKISGDPGAGARIFQSACSGCHGPKGEGADGPALNNQVLLATATDTFLMETIGRGRRGTTMEGFRTPSPVRPALTDGEIASVVAFLRSWEGSKK